MLLVKVELTIDRLAEPQRSAASIAPPFPLAALLVKVEFTTVRLPPSEWSPMLMAPPLTAFPFLKSTPVIVTLSWFGMVKIEVVMPDPSKTALDVPLPSETKVKLTPVLSSRYPAE
jgi:hypothetical protein